MSDGRHLKVAVIGVGNIGSAHARAIYSGEVSGMKLAALCDRGMIEAFEGDWLDEAAAKLEG